MICGDGCPGAGGGAGQRALADEVEQAARQLEQLRREAERQGTYRGSADALNHLLPGNIQMMNEINVLPHVKAGKLILLAINGAFIVTFDRISVLPASGPDIVELAESRKLSVETAAKGYFAVGGYFGLDWLRTHIEDLDTEGHWHAVARGSLREALFEVHRSLAQGVLESSRETDPAKSLDRWLARGGGATLSTCSMLNLLSSFTEAGSP